MTRTTMASVVGTESGDSARDAFRVSAVWDRVRRGDERARRRAATFARSLECKRFGEGADEQPALAILQFYPACVGAQHLNLSTVMWLGRSKKRLAGKPELGDTGDLFLPVVTLVSERMPAAVLFENVPAFGSSLTGELLGAHIRSLGRFE